MSEKTGTKVFNILKEKHTNIEFSTETSFEGKAQQACGYPFVIPSTQEAGAGRACQVQMYPGTHSSPSGAPWQKINH